MSNMKSIRLVLFFSKDVSLKDWDVIGMFDREVEIYKRLCYLGVSISFITYGDSDDLAYQSRIKGINILCNKWNIKNVIYQKYLYLIHWKYLINCDVIKTNQANGSEIALTAAKFWKKPLLGRMGYLLSDFVAKKTDGSEDAILKAIKMEDNLFNLSNRIIVTTESMANSIKARSHRFAEKTIIIPNYVDTDCFMPDDSASKDFDLIFIGRLSHQKNIKVLLEAVKYLNIKVLIIGDGELRKGLQSQYGDLNGSITWKSNIPNHDLPSYLNRSRIFILPSLYEGHPKALIEAMSCGLAAIGANSPGISELIIHNYNGWLCDISSESISNEIQFLLNNSDLCSKLGENARKYVIENFALDHIINLEMNAYESILY